MTCDPFSKKPHRFRRQSPRWWPEGEPWPPNPSSDAQTWHRARGRFVRRVVLSLAITFTLAVVACTLLFTLAQSLAGSTGPARVAPGILPILVIVILGLLLAGRAFRHVATPLGDVVEATHRVAAGDYAVRIVEQGPPEVRSLAQAFNAMATQLQMNDEQRRNLLADVTHELRTPLTVIQGNLEGLLDGVYPRDDDHLTYILEETRILSRLVDDLRTLALAESGALHLQKEITDIGLLVQETVSSFRGRADAQEVKLETEVQANLPGVNIDPARIRQVLENILANALFFTPPAGTIQVRCKSSKNAAVVVSVGDTVAGISPADLPRIFDRFYKSRASRGTGLGLAIAKNLVVAHGGEISAQSEPGHGTTITFSIPTVPA